MAGLDRQKAHGVYYTPRPLVRYVVQRTLAPLLEAATPLRRAVRLLDPACGDGAFLTEAYRFLLEHQLCPHDGWRQRRRLLLKQIYGLDIDGAAVEAARQHLARMAAVEAGVGDDPHTAGRVARLLRRLRANLQCRDALLGHGGGPGERSAPAGLENIRPYAWREAFPEVFRQRESGFDAILGNPPFVNIRLLSRSRGDAVKQYLRQRYRCAFRAYDLYVLFLELAFELLRPGGRCGMIVPNKIGTLDYALPCRSLLLERTALCEILDLSEVRAFPRAGVYPYVLIWEKGGAAAGHRVSVARCAGLSRILRPGPVRRILQRSLSAEGGFPLDGCLDVERRAPTVRLGDCADLRSGTTGFLAQDIAGWLVERDKRGSNACFEFIVSGNIDRYTICRRGVRFMHRAFRRPCLPADCPCLSRGKRELFRGPKIVLAGMVRRLEAAWDAGGLSLGVQVYAIARPQDPWFLLGLLNSKLFSFLFRSRFSAKSLAGGYLAVNKGQLAQLPVRVLPPREGGDLRRHDRMVELVQQVVEARRGAADIPVAGSRSGSPPDSGKARGKALFVARDREIDGLVYELYRLTDEEVRRVEAAVAE